MSSMETSINGTRQTEGERSIIAAILRVALWMGIDLFVLALFTGVLIGLVLVYGATLRFIADTIAYAILCMVINIAVVLPIRLWYQRQKILVSQEIVGTIRDWLPFTLLLLVYENLRLYTSGSPPSISVTTG